LNETTHIINKVVVEINTRDREKAEHIKNNMNGFLQDELFQRIEKLFDKYEEEEIFYRTEKLTIKTKLNDWKNSAFLLEKLDTQIRKNIETENQYSSNTTKQKKVPNRAGSQLETFFFFLENGQLPWYAKPEQLEDFLSPINWKDTIQKASFRNRLKKRLVENPHAGIRLVYQLAVYQFLMLVNSFGVIEINNTKWLAERLTNFSPHSMYLFFHFLIKASIFSEPEHWQPTFKRWVNHEKHISKPKVQPVAQDFFKLVFDYDLTNWFEEKAVQTYFYQPYLKTIEYRKTANYSGMKKNKGNQFVADNYDGIENNPTIVSKESIAYAKEKEPRHLFEQTNEMYVQNAGMVLFYPFLKYYFKNIGCLNKNEEIIESKKIIAVQALHHLATGQTHFFEANILLEKLLCNVPINWPVPAKSLLTKEILKESETAIQQLIENWKALKNTSPNGLRQMFIFRNGKLAKVEEAYHLTIERKAQDILLEKLNYPISIIKLPWKKERLHVEW
jgi:hypothetical protein